MAKSKRKVWDDRAICRAFAPEKLRAAQQWAQKAYKNLETLIYVKEVPPVVLAGLLTKMLYYIQMTMNDEVKK